MEITDVRIRINDKNDNKLRAVAAVTFDGCFAVHDIKIIEGQGDVFIAMPSKKTVDGTYKDIAHPINTETRKYLSDTVLAAYKAALEGAE